MLTERQNVRAVTLVPGQARSDEIFSLLRYLGRGPHTVGPSHVRALHREFHLCGVEHDALRQHALLTFSFAKGPLPI
jgi:hypothetical protein